MKIKWKRGKWVHDAAALHHTDGSLKSDELIALEKTMASAMFKSFWATTVFIIALLVAIVFQPWLVVVALYLLHRAGRHALSNVAQQRNDMVQSELATVQKFRKDIGEEVENNPL